MTKWSVNSGASTSFLHNNTNNKANKRGGWDNSCRIFKCGGLIEWGFCSCRCCGLYGYGVLCISIVVFMLVVVCEPVVVVYCISVFCVNLLLYVYLQFFLHTEIILEFLVHPHC